MISKRINNEENNREFVVNSKGFSFCYPYFLFEKILEALIEAASIEILYYHSNLYLIDMLFMYNHCLCLINPE